MKKHILYRIALVLAFLIFTIGSYAVPAKPGLVMVRLPDGTSINVRIVGDERSHYYVSEDGYLLTRGVDDFFYYSDFDEVSGMLISTKVRANDVNTRGDYERAFVLNRTKEIPKALVELPKKLYMKAKSEAESNSHKLNDFPTIGEQKTIAILVQFKDKKFTIDNPKQVFSDFMMKENFTNDNGAHLSVSDYYKTCSDGMFEPQFDVYGPVTLSQNLAYYGGNDVYGNDDKPEEMVKEACELLDDEINFAEYDRNGDGWVDNVYIFYAGYSEAEGASANSIWPHSWDIWLGAQVRLQLDGVYIGPYGCSQELNIENNKLVGIGVFCHEFGHVLGLPDIYSTDYNYLSFTPGAYTLMDAGEYNDESNTPPYLTAYERWVLGWHTPDVIDRAMNATLPPFSSGETKSYLINTTDSSEVYFLENRQQEGYDRFIPGHGMLVWHIDYDETTWKNNTINNLSTHQGIDLVEADGKQTEETRAGDPFPGTSGVTSFTDNSYPSMRDWQGANLNLPITDIEENNGIITFKVLGGIFELDAVNLNAVTDISATSISLSWNSVARANNYLLNLYTVNGATKDYLKRNFEVGNINSYTVTGLQPETEYFATISASDGAHISPESNVVSAVTLEPDFSFYVPTVLEATEINDNSFVANWEALDGADEYFISVYNRNNTGERVESIDFSDGMDSFPEGWETNCNSFIMTDGCFGNASPSLRMGLNGAYIQSPMYPGSISQIEFWYKGAYIGMDNIAAVQITKNGADWEVLDFLDIKSNIDRYALYGKGQEITLPDDVVQFRIYFEKPMDGEDTSGFVYVDDIRVVVEGHDEPILLEGYNNKSVGNSLSCKVEGLSSGTEYMYSVKASNGEFMSMDSPVMYVVTSGGSGILSLENTFRVRTSGNGVYVYAVAGSVVSVYDVSGINVRNETIIDGETVFDLGRGIYLIRCGSETVKVAVR